MTKLDEFSGKVAIVTGASSGIGRLTALRLAQRGARVGLVARRQNELEALAAEISAGGGEAMVLCVDVARRDEVFAAAAAAEARLGPIDLLINNAGYGHHRAFADWDLDDIERMVQVNLLGSIYWTKAVLPSLRQRRRGWLVFVASVAGKIGVPDESAYVATKFGVVGLAESLSYELEADGIHVLTVCPGAVDTPFFDEEALRRMPAVARRTMIRPEAVVEALFDGLARGRHEVTVPGFIRAGYIVRALAPALMRRQTRRATAQRETPADARERRRGPGH